MNAPIDAAVLIPTLPCDAAIPNLVGRGFEALAPVEEVFSTWRAMIAGEQLKDYTIDYTTLTMRPEDGALIRKSALGYTQHGSAQLINLLLTTKPANLNNVLRWIRPAQRAAIFNHEIKGRSTRKAEDLVVLRTTVMTRFGFPVRAIRAAVSTRHSLKHMDDLALSHALQAEITAKDSHAAVNRGVDVTFGMATVAKGTHLTRTLHWQNSETGAASLAFSAGAVIQVVDAVFQLSTASEVNSDLTVAIETGRARVRHTAPGGKDGDEERKAEVANGRMRNGIRRALAAGEGLEAAWNDALKSTAPDFVAKLDKDGKPLPLEIDQWEVLFDIAEGVRGFEGDDRSLLMQVMQNDKRLLNIPQGTSAHFAAAFAALGKAAKTAEDAVRCQLLAGVWITKGWKR